MIDAIGRTLFRLFVSQRNLLQWVTAAQAKLSFRLTLPSAYRRMAGAVVIAAIGACSSSATSDRITAGLRRPS